MEMLSYAEHLTHVLKGPDVVLNKPISTTVNAMVHNNPTVSKAEYHLLPSSTTLFEQHAHTKTS